MTRTLLLLRVGVPTLWMGLIIALSFIEAPLKFTAPGITTPLGLGIGRLVFTALAVAGAVLLITLTAAAFARPRESRTGFVVLGGIWLTVIAQSLVIRPLLNARTDVILAGGDPGESWLHYGYIAAEVVLLVLLIAYLVHVLRGVRIEVRTSA